MKLTPEELSYLVHLLYATDNPDVIFPQGQKNMLLKLEENGLIALIDENSSKYLRPPLTRFSFPWITVKALQVLSQKFPDDIHLQNLIANKRESE